MLLARQTLAYFLLASAGFAGTGCNKADRSQNAVSKTEKQMTEDGEVVYEDPPSLKEVRIQHQGRQILVTLDELSGIQRSLHTYLVTNVQPGSRWYEDREYLLSSFRGAPHISAGDGARIGSWSLVSGKETLELRASLPGFAGTKVRYIYTAELAFDDAWHVASLDLVRYELQ